MENTTDDAQYVRPWSNAHRLAAQSVERTVLAVERQKKWRVSRLLILGARKGCLDMESPLRNGNQNMRENVRHLNKPACGGILTKRPRRELAILKVNYE